MGLAMRISWPSILNLQVCAWNSSFQGGEPALAAKTSTAKKPILCRVSAYLGPGFPSPTTKYIDSTFSKKESGSYAAFERFKWEKKKPELISFRLFSRLLLELLHLRQELHPELLERLLLLELLDLLRLQLELRSLLLRRGSQPQLSIQELSEL